MAAISILLFLLLPVLSYAIDSAANNSSSSSSSSCPIDLTYVQTFPWNTSSCRRQSDPKNCCFTLVSLFGVGLARHLNSTSRFQLPDAATSAACISQFQSKLASFSIHPSVSAQCFPNPAQFVTNTSNCAGIVTAQDWVDKIGESSPLDEFCKGDLSGLTRCGACYDAGVSVNSKLKGLDPNGTKCFDFTVLYAAGVVNQFGPQNPGTASCILGLSLSRSVTEDPDKALNKDTILKLIFGLFGALIGVLLAVALIFWYRKWDLKRRQNLPHQEFIESFRTGVLPNAGAKWFSLSELEKATNGFSQKNMIGRGGYGVVYKGTLADGAVVAVKQILDVDSKGDSEFTNEVELISKIRHRNLLSLRGCCLASDFLRGRRRFLVYDYMSKGSVSDHIADERVRKELSWPQRKNIILDVAKGLAYLHQGLKPAIYHRDIKATNVLLDSEMKAKVADFGLAKQNLDGETHLTTRVAGTHGYLAPEYALYGQLTEKSDVYSFGILVLEIMSGRKVLDTTNPTYLLITDWAWTLAKSGKVEEILDEFIKESTGPKGVMARFVLVGILCAHVMVALRPTISEALRMLEGDIDIPTLPDRPLPLSHESFSSCVLHSSSSSGRTSRASSVWSAV